MIDVGIVGVGTYLPEKTMKAAEIAGLTNGVGAVTYGIYLFVCPRKSAGAFEMNL